MIFLKELTTDRRIKCHPFFSFVVIKKEWSKISGNLLKKPHKKFKLFAEIGLVWIEVSMRHKRSAL